MFSCDCEHDQKIIILLQTWSEGNNPQNQTRSKQTWSTSHKCDHDGRGHNSLLSGNVTHLYTLHLHAMWWCDGECLSEFRKIPGERKRDRWTKVCNHVTGLQVGQWWYTRLLSNLTLFFFPLQKSQSTHNPVPPHPTHSTPFSLDNSIHEKTRHMEKHQLTCTYATWKMSWKSCVHTSCDHF